MAFKFSLILIIILVFSSACGPRNKDMKQAAMQGAVKTELSGTISVSGAFALYPLIKKWADDFMILHPEVKIEVLKTGTGQGIEDLISRKSKIAMISRTLTTEELSSGVWEVPVAKDGVAPIVNQRNPYLKRIMRMGLSTDEFIKLFAEGDQVKWGELLDTTGIEPVMVFSRSDESGAADIWAEFLYKRAEDIKGLRVEGDEEMIRSVLENPFSIGFCNFSYAFDIKTGERLKDLQIVPFDLNFDNTIQSKEIPFSNLDKVHRGLWLGLYPKNLCRELSIGTIGKPEDPLVVEFIRHALTKGQGDVKSLGLCELNDVYIQYSLDKLK